MARCDPYRINRALQRSQAKVEEARRELEAERLEPIHRYTFPIPRAVPVPASSLPTDETAANLTQILEQLQRQSQLMVDLLGAVNSLIATQLCKQA